MGGRAVLCQMLQLDKAASSHVHTTFVIIYNVQCTFTATLALVHRPGASGFGVVCRCTRCRWCFCGLLRTCTSCFATTLVLFICLSSFIVMKDKYTKAARRWSMHGEQCSTFGGAPLHAPCTNCTLRTNGVQVKYIVGTQTTSSAITATIAVA